MPFPAPIAPSYRLEDGGGAVTASRAGRVGGAARVFDCGAGALFDGYLVFDITAINTAGNRTYGLRLQASNSPTFASGVVDIVAPGLAMAGTGDHAVIVTNQVVDTRYRYLRAFIDVGGTSPTITLSAWLIHKDSLDDYSLAQLTGLLAVAVTRFSNASHEFRAWAGGTLTGGPNGDGAYPLSDGFGNSHLVPCPARIAAGAGISFGAINSLTARTAPFAASHSGPTVPIIADGEIRKMPLDLFASRRTADLDEWTQGAEGIDYFIQVLNASNGRSYRAEIGAVLNTARGFIDVTAPPYNCRFDGTFTKFAETENGSNIIQLNEHIAGRARVGHVLQVSNGLNNGPVRTVVTEVLDGWRIRVAQTMNTDSDQNDCLFGTDNTIGLQAALLAARAHSTYTYGNIVQLPAGIGLTGALRYYERAALFGRGVRQTMLMRIDDGAVAPAWYEYWQPSAANPMEANEANPSFVATQPAPLLRAANMYCDFPAIGDMSIHGARWCQSTSYAGLTMHSHVYGTPGPALPQTDSYPMFSRMHIVDAGWNALEHTGSHSGSIMMVEIMGAGGAGVHFAGYDANITNILVIGCTMPGMVFQQMGVNNNLLNVKLSFNGNGGGWLYGDAGFTNLLIDGDGNNITNMRVQESLGSSVWIRGSGNQLADTMIDDTGCIAIVHEPWNAPAMPDIRAAVMLDGGNYNRFNDVIFGGAVHVANNYATHGLYCQNNPMHNSGRIESKNFPKYDDAQYYPNGHTSGALRPRAVNTSDAGIDASNRIRIDDELLTEYYP